MRTDSRGHASGLLAVLALLLATAPALAQQGTAILQGTVLDESKAMLPGVSVTARNEETGAPRTVVTDDTGRYRMPALLTGRYTVTVGLSGFRAEERSGIQLSVGQEATLDFQLQLSTIEETVTVTGTSPMVDAQRSHVSTTIDNTQIQELPLISRNFLSLAALVPGAGRNTSPTGTQPLAFGASDSRSNYTTIIDGGDLDDDIWGAPVQSFMQDSIKEFQVITNRFDAEYGQATEAVLNVVSKSGTNDYSGTAFVFARDAALKARNYFEAPRSPSSISSASAAPSAGRSCRTRRISSAPTNTSNEDRPLTVSIPLTSPLSRENGTFAAGRLSHLMSGRFDHQLTTNHRAMARVLYEDFQQMGSFGGTNAYSYGREQSRTSLSMLAQETAILSSKHGERLPRSSTETPTSAGHRTRPTRPRSARRAASAPPSSCSRRNGTATSSTTRSISRSHEPQHQGRRRSDATWRRRTARAAGRAGSSPSRPMRTYDAGNPVTWPIRFEQAINLSAIPLPDTYFGMFFQDDWRVTDQLTLNLGVRWDVDLRVRDNDTMERARSSWRATQSLRPILDENPGKDLDNIDAALWLCLQPVAGHRHPRRLRHLPLAGADVHAGAGQRSVDLGVVCRRGHRPAAAAQLSEHQRDSRRHARSSSPRPACDR